MDKFIVADLMNVSEVLEDKMPLTAHRLRTLAEALDRDEILYKQVTALMHKVYCEEIQRLNEEAKRCMAEATQSQPDESGAAPSPDTSCPGGP